MTIQELLRRFDGRTVLLVRPVPLDEPTAWIVEVGCAHAVTALTFGPGGELPDDVMRAIALLEQGRRCRACDLSPHYHNVLHFGRRWN